MPLASASGYEGNKQKMGFSPTDEGSAGKGIWAKAQWKKERVFTLGLKPGATERRIEIF
ncbi:MAG TPA: hypothetical protein P5349_08220 [Tenuifilaceae bacterium]|nr:hypothetical protein [Tenuifilaceae bacterium]